MSKNRRTSERDRNEEIVVEQYRSTVSSLQNRFLKYGFPRNEEELNHLFYLAGHLLVRNVSMAISEALSDAGWDEEVIDLYETTTKYTTHPSPGEWMTRVSWKRCAEIQADAARELTHIYKCNRGYAKR